MAGDSPPTADNQDLGFLSLIPTKWVQSPKLLFDVISTHLNSEGKGGKFRIQASALLATFLKLTLTVYVRRFGITFITFGLLSTLN